MKIRRGGARRASALLIAFVSFWGAEARAEGYTADPLYAAAKLRHYCKACHAVGTMKFITTEDDRELWASLFTERAPRTGKLWAEGIVEVLAWPSDAPPPFDSVMDPPSNRDWMPKGQKRLELAAERDGTTVVRRSIVDALRAELDKTAKSND